MTIHYATAWRSGDIGGGLNAAIDLLPDDAWVCVRDGDSMFLHPEWGQQVEAIIAAHGDAFGIIGAMTNRLRSPLQCHEGSISDNGDINHHVAIARQRWETHGAAVNLVRGPVAAMCMLFRKSLWTATPFRRGSYTFDSQFCVDSGARLGVAPGLYVFHLYRWGHPDPANYLEHLR